MPRIGVKRKGFWPHMLTLNVKIIIITTTRVLKSSPHSRFGPRHQGLGFDVSRSLQP